MKTSRLALFLLFALALGLATLSGCASSGGDGEAPAETQASKDTPAPAGSKLAQVKIGMNDAQVRNIMGDPDNANAYMTGKSWIPFYYGPDTHRTDWMYKGVGRVVFSRNRYSGSLKAIRILYNPSETAGM